MSPVPLQRLSANDLIMPYFVVEGERLRREVPSMPGVFQLSADVLCREAAAAHREGLRLIILFGVPLRKDLDGSAAWEAEGVVQNAVRRLKKEVPSLGVVTDVCLCQYTSHGHCGIIPGFSEAARPHAKAMDMIDLERTLEALAKTALSHAEAGADMVAPSSMMPGQVGRIRRALDGKGFRALPIMGYSAKFASAFYGPFREAAGSAPTFGDRSSYQMDPASIEAALRGIRSDIDEGAAIVMVKPALAYLDIINRVASRFEMPLAAYNVSGEYAMVKAASLQGWIDERKVVLEIMTALRRAGASTIISYHARDAARWMKETG